MTDNRTWWVNQFYNALKSLAEPYKNIEPPKECMEDTAFHFGGGHIAMNVTPKQAMIIVHILEREVDKIDKGEGK